MQKLKKKFTKWYIKKGYQFHYEACTIEPGSVHCYITVVPVGDGKAVFTCPRWVRPFLIFFSPSVYYIEKYGKQIMEGIIKGIERATQTKTGEERDR